jgi:hypothetical protein
MIGERGEKVSNISKHQGDRSQRPKNLGKSLSCCANSSFVVVVPDFLLIEVNSKKKRKIDLVSTSKFVQVR